MITSLVGENGFLLRAELKKRIDSFLKDYDEFGLQKIDGDEARYDQMQEAVQSLPFLAAKKLVVLERPGSNKQFLDKYETLFADVPEITDIIIVEPAVDKRTSYYKWLKKATTFTECKTPSENELTAWAVKYAKAQGGVLSAGDARYLIQRVSGSQEGLAHEIEKLVLYSEKVDKKSIDTLTELSPQSKIFDLLDAAFSGNKTRAISLYEEQRAQKVQPQEIIAMMGWQLRQIALAKTAGQHDLVREGKVSPYGADKAKRIASRIPFEKLKTQVHDLVSIDAQSKRTPLDLDEALQNYIVNL